MPSKAPTYYHWSHDKPCTTNQVYGFYMKDEMEEKERTSMNPSKKSGPFDYVRPFSNLGFFPEIKAANGSQRLTKSSMGLESRSVYYPPKKPIQNKTINRGYTAGYVPVYSKVTVSKYPAGVKLQKFQATPPAFQRSAAKEKEIFLWHTLSGCLVHCKNPVGRSLQAITSA